MRKSARQSQSSRAAKPARKLRGKLSSRSSGTAGGPAKALKADFAIRAVIYCRVSTKEQTQNLSLPTQERACRAYCDQNGFVADRVFVDAGESAKTTERPEFQQ